MLFAATAIVRLATFHHPIPLQKSVCEHFSPVRRLCSATVSIFPKQYIKRHWMMARRNQSKPLLCSRRKRNFAPVNPETRRAAVVWPAFDRWRKSMIAESTITCPECGHRKTETMPTDACQWFYECEQCHTRLKPKDGDCCVFCSYGDVPCPPIQAKKHC